MTKFIPWVVEIIDRFFIRPKPVTYDRFEAPEKDAPPQPPRL